MIACHRSSPLLIAALALALLVPRAALGQVASGQEVGPYDPLGVRAGNFFIFPVLSVSQEYDTNVFDEPNDTDDDLITVIQPHVDVRSNFPRHALGFTVGSNIGLHVNETDENYEDVFATADGQLDVTRTSQLSGALNAGRFHQGRDDPEDPGAEVADELTQNYRYGGSLSYLQAFNRLNVRVTGRVTRNDYQDAGDFDNNDRDNLIYDAILRTGFYVSPRVNVFVQGSYNIERRDQKVDDNGIERDNEGWGASAGSEIGLTELLTGEFHVGFRQQSFDEGDDQQGVGYGVDLTWSPTQLTTVDLTGNGDFEPTTNEDSEARFRSSAGLAVNHELLRNVVLNGAVGYIRDDFRSTDRVDNTVTAGGGASYLINRNFSVNAGYTFQDRQSDDNDEEFTAHVFRVGVTAQL